MTDGERSICKCAEWGWSVPLWLQLRIRLPNLCPWDTRQTTNKCNKSKETLEQTLEGLLLKTCHVRESHKRLIPWNGMPD